MDIVCGVLDVIHENRLMPIYGVRSFWHVNEELALKEKKRIVRVILCTKSILMASW